MKGKGGKMFELWDHQKRVKERAALYDDGIFLAHDMGCGKTRSAIEIAEDKDAKKILIVCPLSVTDNWPEQVKMYERKKFKILVMKEKPESIKPHPDVYYAGKKTVEKKTEFLKDFIKTREALKENYIVVINYESFWRKPLGPSYGKQNRLIDTGYFTKIPWDCLIFDESHRIKTPTSNVSKFAYRTSRTSKFKILMTGTPMAKPFDVFAQFRILSDKYFGTSFFKFKNEYAEFGGFEGREVIRYKNLDELNRIFYTRADRVTRNDVLELPDVSHKVVYYDMSPKCQKIYKDLEKEFVAELETGEIMTVNNALTKMLRLQQISTGFFAPEKKGEEGRVVDDSLDKTIKDVLEDFDKEEPLVFFTIFQNEMMRVRELLEKDGRSVGLLGMGENDLYKFKNGEINCIVVQMSAGGAGIDLTRSCYGFYVAKNFRMLDYLQSLARQDRPGQTRKVLFTHFIARGTISEKIMRAIENNEDLIESVLDEYKFKKKLPLNHEDEQKIAA